VSRAVCYAPYTRQVGPGLDPSTDVGPMISPVSARTFTTPQPSHAAYTHCVITQTAPTRLLTYATPPQESLKRAKRLIHDGVEAGATVLLDGRDVHVPGHEKGASCLMIRAGTLSLSWFCCGRMPTQRPSWRHQHAHALSARLTHDSLCLCHDGTTGNFLGPTILSDVTGSNPAYTEEIFGPVSQRVCVWMGVSEVLMEVRVRDCHFHVRDRLLVCACLYAWWCRLTGVCIRGLQVLSIVAVDTLDEAIQFINANPYGNGTVSADTHAGTRYTPGHAPTRRTYHPRYTPRPSLSRCTPQSEGIHFRTAPVEFQK
jgi:hypothetical protein